jgi:hypothetical protein
MAGRKKPTRKPKAETLTFETVRETGLMLPGVDTGATFGWPCLKVNGKLFAWMPVKKDVEPGTLALRIDFDQREALLEEAPDTYYLTDHYVNYPAVLVRLNRLDRNSLRDLLQTSHRFVTTQATGKSRSRRSRLPKT